MGVKVLIFSIFFILAGLAFCITGFCLKNSSKKNSASSVTAIVFYLIGSLTLVSGILGLCFKNEITKRAVQFYALIYLIIISIIFFIITKLIKTQS